MLTYSSYVFLALTHWYQELTFLWHCSNITCRWVCSHWGTGPDEGVHWYSHSQQFHASTPQHPCGGTDLRRATPVGVREAGALPTAGWEGEFRGLTCNTLRPRQNGRHFADAIFKCIFFCENVWIPIKVSLKFVPKGPIDNKSSLVQVMTWRRTGDKPLPEQRMTHVCVTQPQWVKRPRKMDHIL